MDVTFLKDRSDSELARKDKLTDSLNLPIGILTAVGGPIGVMVSGFSYQIPGLNKIFVTIVALDFRCVRDFASSRYQPRRGAGVFRPDRLPLRQKAIRPGDLERWLSKRPLRNGVQLTRSLESGPHSQSVR